MANRIIQLPIKGYSEGFPVGNQPPLTTGYINNVFPRGALEGKIKLTQRPGFDKAFSQQIGGSACPIVAMIQMTVLD